MNNTIKIFFRLLKRNKLTSIISIGGFAVSMSVFLILFVFLIGEKNINSSFKNAENIYRIERSDNQSVIPLTLLGDIQKKVPEIRKTGFYCISSNIYKHGNERGQLRVIGTNDDFLEMFSFQFIHQNSDPSLRGKSNIILTSKFSKKLFGKTNPVGEPLQLNNKNYNIVGVVDDIPVDASFHFDVFVNMDEVQVSKMGYHNEQHLLYNAFIMLNPEVSANLVETKLEGIISHWKAFEKHTLLICPLKDVYFNGLASDMLDHANVQLIYLLAAIAFIILSMSIFNYVNTTISGSADRMVEFGVKKTAGAAKAQIAKQVIWESVLTSLLAMFLALVIASLIAPIFSEILDKQIEIMNLFLKTTALVLVLFFVAIGIISGLYPALVFSGISPLRLIGKSHIFKKQQRRTGVIAIQFFISTILIISLLLIQKQIVFVKHKDYGFNTELLLSLRLAGNATKKAKVIKDELLSFPQFISVSGAAGNPMMSIPGSSKGKFDIGGQEKTISVNQMSADEDYVKTMGLTIVEGRNFYSNDSNSCLINEHLYKELEWNDLNGKEFQGRKIVGVLKDFHFEKLYNTIGNIMIEKSNYAWWLNIRINGDVAENLNLIKQTYAKVEPDLVPTINFFDDYIENLYQKEERQAKSIKVFALIAILISCLGLIGTAEQTIRNRTKEIGIRKVNGAKVSEILSLLNKDFIKWVAIAFVVACPIAYYAMNKWLENFAYKTTLSWWIFALAGVLALGIALLTVSWQSWRAATRNPVEALRYE